ncbi:MAG: phosphonate ABC transporter ATP-binding protein [Bacillota bacterium]
MRVVEAENLIKTFPGGGVGLKGLSLQIQKGERVGIMGRSGAGKTTLLRLINGSIVPTSGSLKVLGRAMGQIQPGQLRELRSKLAVVQQNHNVVPGMTVFRNTLMGRLGHCSFPGALRMMLYPTGKEMGRVLEILSELEIEDKMHQRCQELSGGQQQRVAVARALFGKPEMILADEPVASVDARTARVVLNRFLRLNQEKGVTVIVSLHQPDFAIDFCTRVLVMDGGQLVYDGEPRGAIEISLKHIPFQGTGGVFREIAQL